ncbi:Glutamyl-tRNA amidotransferase B subunit [Tilletiaria anomala UBC 951]|uniref:Glutamyl-tRNA(Gln) amidotransferase subunit B, mitochondrial n=1 Tax=Tilletiaria anomala (strain ATCC 24038 / CBS 436.72 / UBC 951) TaxID=1037660 RepID=A0A066WFT2_TILAU|nr:Glutamyl-tRNA amidotransferase B subunit [Tilletiaria anomala UBC 951]KDN52827.1 Glutamyl-tRNA amidotransferase B subunit [Tilletiaria anomala UBC 951]
MGSCARCVRVAASRVQGAGPRALLPFRVRPHQFHRCLPPGDPSAGSIFPTLLHNRSLCANRVRRPCQRSSSIDHVRREMHQEPGRGTSSHPTGSKSAAKAALRKGKQARNESATASDDVSKGVHEPLPPGWNMVIGIECHAQIKTKHKLFSPSRIPPFYPPAAPNTHVAPFDRAVPGTLPKLNHEAVELAVKAALALGCEIMPDARFDRKHYFYHDLPPGYQITMKYKPLAKSGSLRLRFDEGYLPSPQQELTVQIEQLQIEQDTAKTYTSLSADGSTTLRQVDLNRAGVGLMEIVSAPDMRTREQAGAYVRKLQQVLRKVGASDGNMEQGSLRCDVNVSVHQDGQPWGTRTEVKNVSSPKFIMNAVASEARRQVQALLRGDKVVQETRAYDELSGETVSLRSKENAMDYRFMPDPSLPPLDITEEKLQHVRDALPELPDALRDRLVASYGLNGRDLNVLLRLDDGNDSGALDADSKEAAHHMTALGLFEDTAKGRDPLVVCNWIINELVSALGDRPFSRNPVSAQQLGELIDLVESKRITGSVGKALLSELASMPPSISMTTMEEAVQRPVRLLELLRARGQLSLEADELQRVCADVVRDLPQEVGLVRQGRTKVLMRLVGEVMKRARGRADAQGAAEVLRAQIAAAGT